MFGKTSKANQMTDNKIAHDTLQHGAQTLYKFHQPNTKCALGWTVGTVIIE